MITYLVNIMIEKKLEVVCECQGELCDGKGVMAVANGPDDFDTVVCPGMPVEIEFRLDSWKEMLL